jgi:hypothetical protein
MIDYPCALVDLSLPDLVETKKWRAGKFFCPLPKIDINLREVLFASSPK